MKLKINSERVKDVAKSLESLNSDAFKTLKANWIEQTYVYCMTDEAQHVNSTGCDLKINEVGVELKTGYNFILKTQPKSKAFELYNVRCLSKDPKDYKPRADFYITHCLSSDRIRISPKTKVEVEVPTEGSRTKIRARAHYDEDSVVGNDDYRASKIPVVEYLAESIGGDMLTTVLSIDEAYRSNTNMDLTKIMSGKFGMFLNEINTMISEIQKKSNESTEKSP